MDGAQGAAVISREWFRGVIDKLIREKEGGAWR
jgi:hypothetical protein